MTGTLLASWWQYSRWVYLVGRSLKTNPPRDGTERTAVQTFLQYFWNAATSTGTRPWLAVRFNIKAVSPSDDYIGDTVVEPDQIDAKLVQIVGRDLKKIPMTDGEKVVCDTFFAATDNRRYGYL